MSRVAILGRGAWGSALGHSLESGYGYAEGLGLGLAAWSIFDALPIRPSKSPISASPVFRRRLRRVVVHDLGKGAPQLARSRHVCLTLVFPPGIDLH